MSDSVSIEGKEYISSKRAADLSGYAQDYLGQLARSGQIDAQRIGGLWYVSIESLSAYKSKADTFKPEPPKFDRQADPESFISFDGKDYISAARAAKITSYHQDYIGQLARSGKILSRQIGNRWYVEREALLSHKEEKDALLAALQSESVGITSPQTSKIDHSDEHRIKTSEPAFLTYTNETDDLMPVIQNADPASSPSVKESYESEYARNEQDEKHSVPIRVTRSERNVQTAMRNVPRKPKKKSIISGKTIFYGTLAASALTVVIVLSFGVSSIKDSAVYAIRWDGTGAFRTLGRNTLTASAAEGLGKIGDILEEWFVPELSYKRAQ